jgi:hypothetical protein
MLAPATRLADDGCLGSVVDVGTEQKVAPRVPEARLLKVGQDATVGIGGRTMFRRGPADLPR